MEHIIIILHFFCIAIGTGFITLTFLVYKKDKIEILKYVVVGEVYLLILLLIDTICIYVRKLLVEYNINSFIGVINYILVAVVIYYLYKIIKEIKRNCLHKRLNIQMKIVIGLIILNIILLLLSYSIVILESGPYICMIYILQCILGVICIKEKEKNIKSVKEELKCLTDREQEIVDYVAKGLNNKEIGEKLFISPNTVKNHIYNIYKKLNVKNKVELINRSNKGD